MRDYFVEPAQTNLELYAQALEADYLPAQRRSLADAYLLALRSVYPLARGSGKPFIAHLVGTASLVLASGCPATWVTGALLHALYQRRVPFEGGLVPEQRRAVVAERFGTVVDDLVLRYTTFESVDLHSVPAEVDEVDRGVLTLRLADELEDLCGNALALHGDAASDALGVRGGYRRRREAKTRQAPALLDLARRLQLHGIRYGIERWLDFSSSPEGLADMRTGWLSSVNLTPGGDL